MVTGTESINVILKTGEARLSFSFGGILPPVVCWEFSYARATTNGEETERCGRKGSNVNILRAGTCTVRVRFSIFAEAGWLLER